MKIEQLIKKHIKEMYEIKKSNNYLSESIPPAALRNVINSVSQLSKTRITQKLQNLLSRRGADVDGFIEGVTNNGTPFTRQISNGQDFFNNFILGKVTERDAEVIFKEIFKSVDEESVISDMADFIIKNNTDFVNRHKMKPKEQIISELTPVYGKKQSEILAKKIYSRSITPTVRNIAQLFGEAWGRAWVTPGLIKVIAKLRGRVNGENSWKLLVRWVVTGTTRNLSKDVKELFRSLRQNGVSTEQAMILTRLITSLGMEVFQRWIILNGSVMILKIIAQYTIDNYKNTGEREKRSDDEFYDLVMRDIENNWPNYEFAWVWPAGTVKDIVFKTVEGIVRRYKPMQLVDYVTKGKLPEQQELQRLDGQVESTFNPLEGIE
jgi:hypothetical protein